MINVHGCKQKKKLFGKITYVYISNQAILKFVLGKKCKDNEEFKDLISKEQIWLSNKD